MLRRFLFTGFICLLFNTSFSQIISSQRKEDMNIKKFRNAPVYINFPDDFIAIPINSISVVDARPDSSAIGLYQLSDLHPKFIVTPGSFQLKSESYIKKYVHCSNSDSFSVVMILKKFWISTDDIKTGYSNIINRFNNNFIINLDKDTSKINVSLSANIEFYLFKDSGYYTLYRFDSVFSADIKKPIDIARDEENSYAAFMLRDALETSLSKLARTNGNWSSVISSKRKFTLREIEGHEHQMFEIPVLKDSVLVPGVYMTFEEFKSNSPSVTEFEITKDKLNDFIYAKQSDGRQTSLSDVWGYCDTSNQIFVRSNHNYFKLQRRQNAFYVYGSNQTLHKVTVQSWGAMPGTNGYPGLPGGSTRSDEFSLVLKPFQLDWDSGKLY
jgi:hypothetical protein